MTKMTTHIWDTSPDRLHQVLEVHEEGSSQCHLGDQGGLPKGKLNGR